ncbi:MAG: single-stranded-DNA-specific exonuclease RecJ [Calditrichaeota bacterium]|nr:single-stranded-DNA-specific exonuclease RecJ [Calditrichota bacterium]
MMLPLYRWQLLESDPHLPMVQRILRSRDIDPDDDDLFLQPSFDHHMRDPFLLLDLDKAVKRTVEAIKANEKILVFGDYDADGVTSTALLFSFLKQINANCEYHIPHRLKDGYGITEDGVRYAKERHVDLIITVDNGIAAVDAIQLANELNLDVIITDHHKQGEQLPSAFAIVNPNRLDCTYPFKGISGVGVTFKFIQVLSKEFLTDQEREHFLKWNLDLVAMGTVADVMPLLDENRIFVYYGLKVITKSKRPGIRALLNNEAQKKSNTITIGYKLGPKINAAGRLEAADKALELLLETDQEQAELRAKELTEINHKRQDITEVAVREAQSQLDLKQKLFVISSSEWHQGIVGLISARITDKYYKPSFVFNYNPELQIYKGSGRSPAFFDITKAMMEHSDLLVAGGGHKQACGCTIKAENFERFKSLITQTANQIIHDDQLVPEIEISAEMPAEQITLETLDDLSRLAPFGQNFPDPLFLTKGLKLESFRQVGFEGKHLLIELKTNNRYLKGIAFRLGHLYQQLMMGDTLDVVYSLSKNEWKDKTTVQLIIKDFRISNG